MHVHFFGEAYWAETPYNLLSPNQINRQNDLLAEKTLCKFDQDNNEYTVTLTNGKHFIFENHPSLRIPYLELPTVELQVMSDVAFTDSESSTVRSF